LLGSFSHTQSESFGQSKDRLWCILKAVDS
jgi:hypothetical protein